MREIKFRVYQPIDKKFYYWGFTEEESFRGIPTGTNLSIKKCHRISQQFTGLKDKNGKEIYEGDITSQLARKQVNNAGTSERQLEIRVIKFLNGAFRQCYPDSEDYGWTLRDFNVYNIEFEVIGNIYENPELIKEV